MARLPKGTPTLRDVLREQRRQLRAQGSTSRFAGSGFKVGADGSVTASGVTATSVTVGPVKVTADGAVTTTGPVTAGSATVGTLNAGTANAFNVAANGAVTAPSVTTTGAVAAGGAVTAPSVTTTGAVTATGLVTGANTGAGFAIASGRVRITPTTASVTASVPVTFPVGRFSAVPQVMLTPVTIDPANNHVGTASVSATGFTCYVNRNATTAIDIDWVAVAT